MKNLTRNISLTISISIIFFAVFFYFFSNNNNNISSSNSIINTQIKSSGFPVRLLIPAISVDAPIIEVGLTDYGSVGAPQGPSEVAWFNLSSRPGENGSSVLVGHYGKWKTGANSVFDNLYKLEKGDKISVKNDDGIITTFIVKEIRTYNPEDLVPDIFNKKDGIYLNLITCSGVWIPKEKTYNKRLVVFADIEKP